MHPNDDDDDSYFLDIYPSDGIFFFWFASGSPAQLLLCAHSGGPPPRDWSKFRKTKIEKPMSCRFWMRRYGDFFGLKDRPAIWCDIMLLASFSWCHSFRKFPIILLRTCLLRKKLFFDCFFLTVQSGGRGRLGHYFRPTQTSWGVGGVGANPTFPAPVCIFRITVKCFLTLGSHMGSKKIEKFLCKKKSAPHVPAHPPPPSPMTGVCVGETTFFALKISTFRFGFFQMLSNWKFF